MTSATDIDHSGEEQCNLMWDRVKVERPWSTVAWRSILFLHSALNSGWKLSRPRIPHVLFFT